MPNKLKYTQPETPNEVQGRDLFQTPNYAIDLLIPYIPKHVNRVWECAYGNGKISSFLRKHGYIVYETDLNSKLLSNNINFLTQTDLLFNPKNNCIITNPPFSLKRKFYEKCLYYGVPFALLISADYSGWVIEAIRNGAEKLIPTRRIDYITPTGLSGATGNTSDFHSMWLTYGFNLGRTETFVELSLEDKKNI
jgi:hypothetical protein